MAEKDILEKALMSHTDVFADCVNALAYNGRHRLKAGDLNPAPTESFYRGSRRLHNQFCDVSWSTEGKRCSTSSGTRPGCGDIRFCARHPIRAGFTGRSWMGKGRYIL